MLGRLQGKVALVTGGNDGIGFAVAQRFVREGAYVFITGRRTDKLEHAVATIGDHVEAVPGDIAVGADLDRLFATIQARKGRLDIFVANAGVADWGTLDTITEALYDRTFDVNARATLFTAQRAIALMPSGSTIVLIGSIAGSTGTPGYGVYGASKAAIRSYARTWTNELAARGIRVNTLSPGPIDTTMMARASAEVREAATARIPLGRFGKPEEVAAAALFLASDESSFVAGAELLIDGGLSQT